MPATLSPWVIFAAIACLVFAGIARADDTPAPSDLTEEVARSACPPGPTLAPDSHCAVAGFGVVGEVEGRELLYGLYSDQTSNGDYTLRTAVVVYERQPGGKLRALIAADDPGDIFSEPKLLRRAGRVLLHLPGYEDGTGNFNVERLYVWRDGARKSVDLDAWRKDLARKLPAGYEIWNGVFPDYVKMTAATPLWRAKTDGNCCPTGGRADLVLAWQGDRLVLKSVKVKLGAKYAGQF